MRFGAVTREEVARMARRADAAGQLGMALTLYSLAANFDPADPLGLPSARIDDEALARGHAIDLSGDGRKRRPKGAKGEGVARG